ncbi:GNAT family N-acetyltransferase [Streptomyces sp. AC495_CC817]|uniref:GNAT family N-acetyltransferase n=1 Tax=Streptomyces sp. AC495_CC817 TaxID=2823900 RepID=UPI001C270136|nr:GNAT family N-acetyltransferase [Streptomyces sp. AC495_CC817]
MTLIDAREIPVDPTSAARLAEGGLTYRIVDFSDPVRATAFQRAVTRGFLGGESSAEALAQGRETFESRRNVGVYDSDAVDAFPVATTNSWIAPLTVPGGAEVGMWAISVVTVASTHRRRGIARALLEGELRAAAAAGVPVAGLTVSEATIYGRYGFGPAVPAARFTVDTRRAGVADGALPGRLEYVAKEELAAAMGAVHERSRRARPGQIPGWAGRWEGYAGLSPADADRDKVRGVRYLDEEGETRGVLVYTLGESDGTFRFSLSVRLLVAETADALASLWRFALQHDLVDRVEADLRPVDDPLPWLVADLRGVTKVEHDHGWLRILDLPAALTARRFSAPVDLVIRVVDSLGFAAGVWRLRVDGTGTGAVEAVHGAEADIELDVATLSTLYAGGVRGSALHAAGRIVGGAAAVESLDRAFAAFPLPALDIWY